MRFFFSAVVLSCITLPLSGCLYGQCLDGPCALEREKILNSIKPYGAHWVKTGVTDENRLNDIAACGSARTLYVGFNKKELEAARRPEDATDIAAEGRLTAAWVICMESKGYYYEK